MLTVEELILRLQKLPPKLDVWIDSGEDDLEAVSGVYTDSHHACITTEIDEDA